MNMLETKKSDQKEIQVSDQVALWQLLEADYELIFSCNQCRSHHRLDVQMLVQKHGPETTVGFIRKSHICQCS